MFRWLGGAAALTVVLLGAGCGTDGGGTVVVGVPETTALVEAPAVAVPVSPKAVVPVPSVPAAAATSISASPTTPSVLPSATAAAEAEVGVVVSPAPVVEGGDESGLVGDVPVGPVPVGGVLAGPGESGWLKVFPPFPWEGTPVGEVMGKVLDGKLYRWLRQS